MDPLDRLRAILAESTDPANPPAERIEALFQRLHRLAVVGLSRDPAKAARRVPSYLAAKGYEVIPVNPHAERILGRPARATLDEVEEPLDLVVVFRPSAQAGAFVAQAAARREAPAIWLQEGIRADAAATAAREAGRLVVQDLCAYKVHRALFT